MIARRLESLPRDLARFLHDESAATAIEYALIAVGISIVISSLVFQVGERLRVNFFDEVEQAFENAQPTSP